jgi:hypothetical protein
MKQKIIVIVLLIIIAAMAAAQGWGRGGWQNWGDRPQLRTPVAETVTVSGSLVISHGMPAIKSGNVTYLVGGITRFTGFIEGLKEGAQVTIEGLAFAISQDTTIKHLRPSKLTLSGKTYELSLPLPERDSAPAPRSFNDWRRAPAPQPRTPAPRQRTPAPRPAPRQRWL